MSLRIMCVGYTWRGANEGSLFRSIAKLGYLTDFIETNRYFPISGGRLDLKVAEKFFHFLRVKAFNTDIIKRSEVFSPQVAIFYKCPEVLPETIMYLKSKGIYTVNVYPDVSFFTHGKNLINTIPLYNLIISTKTFSKKDLLEKFNFTNVEFVPHGFDPDIHRPIVVDASLKNVFSTDCAFIGNHSTAKCQIIQKICASCPSIKVGIWGGYWNSKGLDVYSNLSLDAPVFGDLYSAALSSSKIALGLLSEQVDGASSGDLITARTFEIPGIGAFMLHQRTEEIHNYFIEDKEIVCFDSDEELIDKLIYYLNNDIIRLNIANNGYVRALKDHTYNQRAERILSIIKKNIGY